MIIVIMFMMIKVELTLKIQKTNKELKYSGLNNVSCF